MLAKSAWWKEIVTPSWSSFTGVSYEDAIQTLTSALDDLKFPYKTENVRAGPFSGFMLGSYVAPTKIKILDSTPIEIDVHSATAEPALRFTQSLFGLMDDKRRQNLKSVCVIKVQPVNETTRKKIAVIFKVFSKKLPKKPWDVAHHPAFTFSYLKKQRIKQAWQRWINYH